MLSSDTGTEISHSIYNGAVELYLPMLKVKTPYGVKLADDDKLTVMVMT